MKCFRERHEENRPRRLVGVAAVVVGFFVATTAVAEPAPGRRFIAIGTGGPTGVYFAAGNAICRMLDRVADYGSSGGRQHGLRCTAAPTGGSTFNISELQSGELDFGIVQSDWQYHAFHGTSGGKVTSFEGLRAVFSLHVEPLHLVAARGSGITEFADLRGKRVNLGNAGSGQRATMAVLMSAHGLSASDFAHAYSFSPREQVEAICDGRLDAYGFTVGVPNVDIAIATEACGATVIALDSPVEARLVADAPFYAPVTIPAGAYRTLAKPVSTFGVVATLVTRESASDHTVYELVRAVMENIEDFRRLHPAFAALDPRQMMAVGLSAPLHPGARRYYGERGWM